MMKLSTFFRIACTMSFGLAFGLANAGQFYGQDIGVDFNDPRPNSDAACSDFLAAVSGLGYMGLIDFESAPLGNPPVVDLGGGGSLSMENVLFTDGIITGPQTPEYGFNTTAGGEQYLSLNADDTFESVISTFHFDFPISSFGAYISGVGTSFGMVSMTWNDGVDHQVFLTGDATGGCEYLGFTGSGTVTSVTIRVDPKNGLTGDVLGIDDVRYTTRSVPEPTSIAAIAAGGLALLRRRHK